MVLSVHPVDDSYPSSSNLGAPTPPAGFQARPQFKDKIFLKPLEVYSNAVEMMIMLSRFDWNDYIRQSWLMTSPGFETEIGVGVKFRDGESWLKVQHMILALYRTGIEIAKDQKFFQVYTGIFLQDKEVGWLEFRPKKLESPYPTINMDVSDSNILNASLTADRGRFKDSLDNKLELNYHWDGVKINKAQDVFTAVLNAMAISAQYDTTDVGAYIPA